MAAVLKEEVVFLKRDTNICSNKQPLSSKPWKACSTFSTTHSMQTKPKCCFSRSSRAGSCEIPRNDVPIGIRSKRFVSASFQSFSRCMMQQLLLFASSKLSTKSSKPWKGCSTLQAAYWVQTKEIAASCIWRQIKSKQLAFHGLLKHGFLLL